MLGGICGFSRKIETKDSGDITVYPYTDTNGMEYLIVVQRKSVGVGGIAITPRLKNERDNRIIYEHDNILKEFKD